MEQTRATLQKITGIAWALLGAWALSALCLPALALLLWKANLSEGQVRAAVIAIYLLSCFMGGRIAGRLAEKRRFLWGLLAGLAYFLALLALSAVLLPGAMAGWKALLTALALCAGGGMAGGMLA